MTTAPPSRPETVGEKSERAPCVHCRSEIYVPSSYTHGDHIKCGTCGTQHKVSRGDVLRLVIADVAPFREALRENARVVERLEDELRGARRSFGIGVNGLGLGVLYALYQVALNNQPLTQQLILASIGVALLTGISLELANYLFLTKRQRIVRLTADLEEARESGRNLQKVIREAGRL